MRRFGVAAGRVRSSAFRFGDSARRVGLRIHCFRFSARAVSEIALGELVLPLSGLPFGLIASAFRHAPLRSGRSAGWSSGSLLPLFGTHRFGVAAGRVRSSAFRFGNCPRRVGLRVHCFRFSACAASEIAARQVGLRAHCFRFSACAASEWPLGEFVLPPSASEIALSGLAFGLTASAFRHAPLRSCPRRVDLRAHGFRFSGCAVSEIAAWRVGLRAHGFRFSARTASELPLGGLAFGLTASAFRHAPLRGCRSAGWPSGFCFGDCRSAGWASGSRLPLFGTHRSAPPRRRSEDRRSTPTRHLFHFKTLIPTC